MEMSRVVAMLAEDSPDHVTPFLRAVGNSLIRDRMVMCSLLCLVLEIIVTLGDLSALSAKFHGLCGQF